MERSKMLKILLGITETKEDDIITFVLEQASNLICHYCNISFVPKDMETILISVAVDLYRNGYGQKMAPDAVKSISEGDVTISFEEKNKPPEEILQNYLSSLNRFRKAGW